MRALGRLHTVEEALAAIDVARATFDRFSFDLIYARPGQTLTAWQGELTQALALAGRHLSLYQLTIEAGTPFAELHARGKLRVPDSELAHDFYELTQELTERAGLPAYEISNHAAARRGVPPQPALLALRRVCRHRAGRARPRAWSTARATPR